MKLAFISVFMFLVLSSVSAQSVFAGQNRRGGNKGQQQSGNAQGVIGNATAGANNTTATGAGNGANNTTAAGAGNGANNTTVAGAGNGANNTTVAGAGNGANNTTAAGAGNGANNTTAAGAGGAKNNAANADPQTSDTLDPLVISTGFASDGQSKPLAGQTASLTSTNNFINFCLLTLAQFPLTNGTQNKTGSCNTVIMGLLPPADKMVSTLILSPKNGEVLPANKDFTVTLISTNIKLGVFTNAQENYLAAPQTLDLSTKVIIGHTHVTIQLLTSQTTPPDPSKFAFFKGINTPADQQGQVSADVAGGLPPGDYRVCTMTSAANHQPVVMPVAQRGSQDDCTKFTVTADGAANNTTAASGGAANTITATAGGAANNTTATAGGAVNNTTATAGGAANNTTATAGGAANNATATAGGAANNTTATAGKKAAGTGAGKGKRWFSREIV
jgi:hypothetical protein